MAERYEIKKSSRNIILLFLSDTFSAPLRGHSHRNKLSSSSTSEALCAKSAPTFVVVVVCLKFLSSVFFDAVLLSVNLDLFARKNAIIVKTSNVFVGPLFHSPSALDATRSIQLFLLLLFLCL